jgi:glycerophosphoryl diester phosphodiesterase
MLDALRSIHSGGRPALAGSPRPLRSRAGRLLLVAAASLAAALPAAAVDLQGHRGTRGLAPENTLASFRKALEIGVTTLETDLALTADGVLVLVHDPRLSRALTRRGDGRWLAEDSAPIRALTAAEVRAYDVGRLDPSHPDAKSWPEQVPADGERIPTLAELFALARDARSPGGRPVRFNIETKLTPTNAVPTASAEEFARAVVREIRAAGMTERVTVQSFDWRTLRELKRIAPEIRTSCLTVEGRTLDTVREDASGASPWHDGLKRSDHGGSLPRTVQAAGCAAWAALWRNLTPALVAEAHGLGLAVFAWTVNEPSDIERALDLGVDAIITDYPDRARKVFARRGVPVE